MSGARVLPLSKRDPGHLGRYRLLGRLGQGGQGVVYLGETGTGEQVAIKLLHERAESPAAFFKEAETARKVAPFCTARLLDVGEEGSTPYTVTEFIDGPTLREKVEEDGALEGAALYRLAVGTATALAAVHMAGIVHRDFKPGNVLLGPDGPRVIDFGVARLIDATITATSSVIGTPSYMAPEQLAGERVDRAADVFAWGATIAYAANGRPPYGQDTIPAVMNRIMSGQADLGGLTGPLRDLVTDCFHKDPERRPPSRDILLRLLEHTEGPISAPDALAQGHALAADNDRAFADARTGRWTTLRLPSAEPAHGASRRGRLLLALAVVIVTVGTMAGDSIATVASPTASAMPSSSSPPRSPTSTPRTGPGRTDTPTKQAVPEVDREPNTPVELAAAIEDAVGRRRTASFTAEGSMDQSAESFDAKGRLHYSAGSSTNYDMTVHNPDGDEFDSSGQRIILFGDKGYFRSDERNTYPAGPNVRSAEDAHIWMAIQCRRVSSPYNILALLRNTTAIKWNEDVGTRTFRGSAPGGPLAARGPVAAFYKNFGGSRTKVTYTLVVTRDHLPVRLDIDLWTRITSDLTYHSLYSATYRSWGASGTITGIF